MGRAAAILLSVIVLFPPAGARGEDPPAVKDAREAAVAALSAASDRLSDLASALLREKRAGEAGGVVQMVTILLDLERELRALLPAAPPAEPPPPEESPPPAEPAAPEPADWQVPALLANRLPRQHVAKLWGTAKTEEAVQTALLWLAAHQDADGRWDTAGFMKHDAAPPACDGAGAATNDVGVTGLALLAFLGAGETHRAGAHSDTVKRGLRWLLGQADGEGCFGLRPRTEKFTYGHALATLAMAEAYGLTGSPFVRNAAQRGVDFIQKCQNPYLAWRYDVRPQDNDTSVSGFMFWALFVARAAGLGVDDTGFDGMKAWLDKVTEPEYGRVGYTARGNGPWRPVDLMEAFPPDRTESLTAVGVFSRVLLGEEPRKSEMIGKGTELMCRCLPTWDERSGAIDLLYWLFGTQALFQVGGDAFKIWNEALRTALVDHQRKESPAFRGSWDPVDPFGREGGRVYATAVAALTLETYYRYARRFPGRRWER